VDFKINQREQDALKGLPYLPRLVYLEALRPYMDYATGIVGIKRGISYQSLREELYIEPHPGYTNSGSPSKQQIRRAIDTLVRAGLLCVQSEGKKLILKCELASSDYSAQNKPGTNPTHQADTKPARENNNKTNNYKSRDQQADIANEAQPGTPPVSDINYIFVCDAFKKFWQLYPIKQSKPNALDAFKALSPSEELFHEIMSALEAQIIYRKKAIEHSVWMPQWKLAANWIKQRSWEDEQPQEIFLSGETSNANNHKQSRTKDILWESCKDAFLSEDDDDDEQHNTIININAYRNKAN